MLGATLPSTPQIVFDEDRLTVALPNGGREEIRWCEVFAAHGCKVDAIKSHVLFLTFDFDFGEFIETNDWMEGFPRLYAELDHHLKIAVPDWRAKFEAASPIDPPLLLFRSR